MLFHKYGSNEFNATVEGSFTVSLTDLYEPSQPNHFVDLNSSINFEMIWVEPGTFMMGQSNISGASPVHQPPLRKVFTGKHEVTQAQYEAVMKGWSWSEFRSKHIWRQPESPSGESVAQ